MPRRHIFYVSDRTGKTAEAVGKSLLSQFDALEIESKTFSFVDSSEKVKHVAHTINQVSSEENCECIVFNTLVNPDHQKIIFETHACVIDLFGEFIRPLEKSLQMTSSHAKGITHEKFEYEEYQSRIDAVDYTLSCDDGVRFEQYDKADVILLGVSRSGKSPTCIYLAINFSVKAANYPLSMEELESGVLPQVLIDNLDKCVGLTLSVNQLFEMRQKRRPHTKYSEFSNCQRELRLAEKIYEDYKIPYIESTATSIEEISVRLLQLKNLYMK